MHGLLQEESAADRVEIETQERPAAGETSPECVGGEEVPDESGDLCGAEAPGRKEPATLPRLGEDWASSMEKRCGNAADAW